MSILSLKIKRLMRRSYLLSHVYAIAHHLRFQSQRSQKIAVHRLRHRNDRVHDPIDRRTLILEISHGGLGDALLHSHLPRIAKESGRYDRVLVSELTPLRNPAHRRVLWELNPYVDGFTGDPGTVYNPGITATAKDLSSNAEPGTNLLDRIMLGYGLDDGERFHEPEIYYEPKTIASIVGKTIFDPNSVTRLNGRVSSQMLADYFATVRVRVDAQFKPRSNAIPIADCRTYISDESFEEFCDIVHSSKQIYCFATGTAWLAAALGKPANVFVHDDVHPSFLASSIHNYISLI